MGTLVHTTVCMQIKGQLTINSYDLEATRLPCPQGESFELIIPAKVTPP